MQVVCRKIFCCRGLVNLTLAPRRAGGDVVISPLRWFSLGVPQVVVRLEVMPRRRCLGTDLT
jgi:hypothetical protein